MNRVQVYSHTKFQHRFVDSPPPCLCFAIICTPRSGSSVLCEAITQSGLAGVPTEYFDEGIRNRFCEVWGIEPENYLATLIKNKTGPNGVFGFKAHFHQYEIAFGTSEIPSPFNDLKFIWISRRNLVRQAVSYSRAIQTSQWAAHHHSKNDTPVFNYEQIRQLLDQTRNEENRIRQFFKFHSINPLHLYYEEFCNDPSAAALSCLDYLKLNPPERVEFKPLSLKRQADDLTEQWVQRFEGMLGDQF